MAEARRKRLETKERRLREREERATAWSARKEQEIVYLGEEVSAGLNERACDASRLREHGLPQLGSAEEVARAMGITVGALRYLAFTRSTSRTTHYVRFTIPKRTGGERQISAPMPRLKEAQRWILDEILGRVPAHDAAHGFMPQRSIVSNASPHLRPAVLVNVDLKDFFPTVTYRRVKGLFRKIGYSEQAAIIFALICTEPEVTELELDGVTYHVALEQRSLPQGSPASPAITNLICRQLDRRLSKLSADLGFVYTRYADDLSFSADDADADVGKLLRGARWIVKGEGFEVHPDKTRVLRRGRRQEVTGIVVNEIPSVPRDVLRRFRATLYQIEKDGPEGKRWGRSDDVIAAVEGFANYVAMVNPDKGRPLQQQVRALVRRHGKKPTPPRGGGGPGPRPPRPETRPEPEPPPAEPPKAEEPKKKKKWWKVF
jgi:retron-type reverse transcriptase